MHPPHRGLAFLLSLGSLPIACGKPDEDSDTKASDPIGNSESGTGGGSTTSGGSATTGTPTTGGSGGGSTSTSTSTGGELTTEGSQGFITTATTGTSTGGDTEMLPPVTDPTCLAYGAHVVECFPRYESYRQYIGYYCQYYKMYGLRLDGQACADAFEAMFVCFSMLPCEEFGTPEACEKEAATVTQDCPSLPEEGSTDTGTGTSGTSGGSSSTGP